MLEIKLFGPPSVAIDQEPVEGFLSDKVLGLLGYLAVNPGPHAREKLADLLWSDFPADRARANLRQALSNLQKLLPAYFDANRKTARFVPDRPYTLDAAEFGELIESSEISDQTAESVFALFRGEFMEEFYVDGARRFEAWIQGERERLNLQYLEWLRSAGEVYGQSGKYTDAMAALERAVSIEPWQESTHRRLMLLYARTGSFERALAQYERCSRALTADLGVEPAPETIALHERIQAARRLSRPQPPPQPDEIVGRTREMAAVIELLRGGSARLVSLLGTGGAGKTRLASAVLHELAPAFLEGVYFIPLVDAENDQEMFQAIARALNAPLRGSRPPLDQLAGYLKSKEALLVLDNLEHLPETYGILEALLEAAPQVRILATSRRRLNLRWENPVHLEGLEIGEPESVLNSAAGRLFLQTARRVRPDFSPRPQDAEAIHAICSLVEGMPLAIELAAAWLRLLSPNQIAAEMQADGTFIQRSERSGPDRLASLSAAFDHSWDLLTIEEQAAFKHLSVFSGGIPLWAAEQVAGIDLSSLAALVDMSLVRKAAGRRFEIHEQLRQLGLIKLAAAPDEMEDAGNRHAQRYLEWVAGLDRDLRGSGLEDTADRIQTDWANLRTAWQRAVENADRQLISNALRPIYEFCTIRQYFREGRDLFNLAVRHFERDPEDESLAARLRLRYGVFQFYLGRVEDALTAFAASRPLLEDGSAHDLGINLMFTGFAMSHSGTPGAFSDGRRYLERSLEIFEREGDVYYQARCLGNLGNNLLSEGDLPAAVACFRRSLAFFEELDIRWGRASALGMLGKLQQHIHGGRAGTEELKRALALGQELGNLHIVNGALSGLANAALENRDYASARTYLGEALDGATTLGQRQDIAEYLGGLGYAASQAGEDARAEAYFSRSLRMVEENGFEAIRGRLLRYMGMHARARGDFDRAARSFKQALNNDMKLGQTWAAIWTLVEAADLACRWKADHPLLPALSTYLSRHPLTTDPVRGRIANLNCGGGSGDGESFPETAPLGEVVQRVKADLL